MSLMHVPPRRKFRQCVSPTRLLRCADFVMCESAHLHGWLVPHPQTRGEQKPIGL